MKNLLQQKSFLFDKTVAISFAKVVVLYMNYQEYNKS